MRIFNVINQSTKVTDDEIKLMIEACKIQLKEHAAPLLERLPWEIKFGGDDGFPMVFFDNSDQAGALGYHSQDPCGKVWGRVFCSPILDSGGTKMTGPKSLSVVLSHEILETFYNPYINLWANRGDETFVALEICDPVERDCYDIHVSGSNVSVSNFVLEAWFDKEMVNAGRFDYLSIIKRPLALAHGGYNIIFNSETGEIKPTFDSKDDEEEHNRLKPSHPAARTSRNSLKTFSSLKKTEASD